MCALDKQKAWRPRPLDVVAISTVQDRSVWDRIISRHVLAVLWCGLDDA
jgi:hypothetical protein